MSIASSDIMRQSLKENGMVKEKADTDKTKHTKAKQQTKVAKSSEVKREAPFTEKNLNTEFAPKNMLESHSKLYAKYVNSTPLTESSAQVCTVQLTL